MKGETLRRLSAAEVGAGGISRLANEKSYQDKLVSSLWLQARGPNHMARVTALLKLAQIYGIDDTKPEKEHNCVVIY